MKRKPVSFAQHLVAAKTETQPWWDRLENMERIAQDLRNQGEDDSTFPAEYERAQDACHAQIAAIYRRHGI